MERKKIMLGLVLLATVWLGNIGYWYSHQLKEPLFVEQYYHLPAGEQSYLELMYLANHNSPLVAWITIPQYPHIHFYIEQQYIMHSYPHHQMWRLEARFYGAPELIEQEGEDIRVRQLEIMYRDGRKQLVDVGEIIITTPLEQHEDRGFMFMSGGSYSGGGENGGHYTFQATTGITNISLDLGLEGHRYLGDFFQVSYPKEVAAGEQLQVTYSIKAHLADPRSLNMYRLQGTLRGKTMDGDEAKANIQFYYQPYFDREMAKKLIRLRGGASGGQ